MAWTVYLLHFDRPYAGRMQHYVGFTRNLAQRLQDHRESTGSAATRRAFEQGIGFVLARTWTGTPKLARQIKERVRSATVRNGETPAGASRPPRQGRPSHARCRCAAARPADQRI